MKILVANLGSTSFKYRLYDLSNGHEEMLARGAVERIGATNSKIQVRTHRGQSEKVEPVADHADALRICLEQLTDVATGVLKTAEEVAAIGFKAVHAGDVSGVQLVDDRVLDAMEALADVTPAHNPPYIQAMRTLRERFPDLPLVAAFETGFHQSISEALQRYAIPEEWTSFGVRRYGFHGASHRYIAGRMAELHGRNDLKLISCHLGGSSSVCASKAGLSVATSMGMSPQSGLPQNNRVGDFDVFALPLILRKTGLCLEEALDILANRSGLEGLGNVGRDLRDIEAAEAAGNPQAQIALEVFIHSVRHYVGAYLLELGGADAIVFTGGIGENSQRIRSGVCHDLDWFGIRLDISRNAAGDPERIVSTDDSRVAVWTVPTNEEIVVARQARDLLDRRQADAKASANR